MVWLGAAAGAGIPLLAFAAVFLGGGGWLIGSWTWGAVAFIGVALQFSPRTKRFGVGMLLGFVGLVVAGAGACTAFVFTMA